MPTPPLDFDEGDHMQVKEALRDFADGESRNRIFFSSDIPIKKLNNAYSKYITRDEEVLVLVDDTLFGSAKDGLAVSENYLYAKGTLEDFKSVKLSSIRRLASQSNKLGSLDIYVNGNLFITLSTIDKADHEFLISILQTAKDAATKDEKRSEKAARVTAVPSPPRPKPKAKPQTVASEEPLSCDECSSRLPKGSKFCLECGAKVMPKGMCLQCNAKLPENAKFCAECGTPVGKQSGAKAALPDAVVPIVDVDAVRKELADLLTNADKDVSIDSDGDLRINFTTQRVPSLGSKFRGSAMTYSIKVTCEGQTEEDDNRDARFNPTDDGVWFGGPYVRVGRLPAAHYEAAIDASIWAASNLEVHEVKLKEGKLDAPTLGSSRIALDSLKAAKDDSDGSFGVEYELNAYPGNYIHFEIVTEKPGEDADLWPSMDAEGSRSGNSWLYDVKPGDTIYIAFAEYKKIVDGVTVTLSGTATPMEGAYDDAGGEDTSHDDEHLVSNKSDVFFSDFKINAGWERRNDRAICRWIIVWQDLPEGKIAGAIGGYSGGGSFQLEQFYAQQAAGQLIKLLIDTEDKITGDPIDFWEDAPANARSISDDAQDVIFEWNDRDEWEENDQLILLESKSWELLEEQDMLLMRRDYNSFAKDILSSIGITAAPVDGGGDIDWRQAADRAFNMFFNAIRKGEDTDTASDWFRAEIAEQIEAAGISYDDGWEQEITPAQLQAISDAVANRLKGLNDAQGYQVSSDFYHGFIASFSNIIYNRSQEGGGDFDALQAYWDQKIGNELPEECGTRLS